MWGGGADVLYRWKITFIVSVTPSAVGLAGEKSGDGAGGHGLDRSGWGAHLLHLPGNRDGLLVFLQI